MAAAGERSYIDEDVNVKIMRTWRNITWISSDRLANKGHARVKEGILLSADVQSAIMRGGRF